MVGIVVTISPSLSLYRMVVLPLESECELINEIEIYKHTTTTNELNLTGCVQTHHQYSHITFTEKSIK